MEDVDREISEMKLSLNARARTVAESYLTAVRTLSTCTHADATNQYTHVVRFVKVWIGWDARIVFYYTRALCKHNYILCSDICSVSRFVLELSGHPLYPRGGAS